MPCMHMAFPDAEILNQRQLATANMNKSDEYIIKCQMAISAGVPLA